MITAYLTGIHGAGKVELFEGLATAFLDEGYKVKIAEVEGGYTSVQLRAKAMGFGIEEQTTDETQYYLAVANIESDIRNRQLAQKEGADLLINLRSVCDVLAYTIYLAGKQEMRYTDDKLSPTLTVTMDLLRHHIAAYHTDILLAPDPIVPPDNSPALMSDIFRYVWHENRLQVVTVPMFAPDNLELNLQERVSFCKKLIKNRLGTLHEPSPH